MHCVPHFDSPAPNMSSSEDLSSQRIEVVKLLILALRITHLLQFDAVTRNF